MTQSKQNTPDLPDEEHTLDSLDNVRKSICLLPQRLQDQNLRDIHVVERFIRGRAAEAVGGDKAGDNR